MGDRLTRLFEDQRARFLMVGAVNTLVGYGLFVGFEYFVFGSVQFGYSISLVASYAISIVVAFVLYRRFVFIVEKNVLRDFVRFVSVYLVSIVLNLVILGLFIEILGVVSYLAQAISLVVTTVLSYLGHRFFSFRRPAAPSSL